MLDLLTGFGLAVAELVLREEMDEETNCILVTRSVYKS